MTHWALKYIGTPWEYGANGPDKFDCWNFVREVQRVHYGINMPEIDYKQDQRLASAHMRTHPELENWTQEPIAQDGDIVMMARARYPAHVGVWTTANGKPGVLHCLEGAGVVFQQAAIISSHGWGLLKFYRRKQ